MQQRRKPWYKKWWGMILAIVGTLVLILIIALSFAIANEVKKLKNKTASEQYFSKAIYTAEMQRKVEGQSNFWQGSANPKVTVVEFSDFSCPLCKNSFTKIREIGLKYKKDVKIIYRDFPVFEHSLDLALSANCAGEQGLFWLMHDKLFQNQGVYEKAQLLELANQIGADIEKFDDCLTSQKYLKQIQENFTDGQNLGVTGTPTWFINGVKIAGDIPYDLFIEIIEEFINE